MTGPAAGRLADTRSIRIRSGSERVRPTWMGAARNLSINWDLSTCECFPNFRWDSPEKQKLTRDFGQNVFAANLIYFATIMLVKLSILFLYIRTFTESRVFRRIVQALMVVIVVSHVVMILLLRFDRPRIECHWKMMEDEEYERLCPRKIDVNVLYIMITWISTLTVVLDVIIMALPCPAVWRLHLPRPQKLAILITLISGVMWVAAVMPPPTDRSLGWRHHQRHVSQHSPAGVYNPPLLVCGR